jgi:hypothetical protein
MTRPFLVIVWTLDRTRMANANGYSSSVLNPGAANTHTIARPAAEASEMARRGPARSSRGTSSGPATASGASVSPRYKATLARASPTGTSKKIDPARAMATMASPAALARWTSA